MGLRGVPVRALDLVDRPCDVYAQTVLALIIDQGLKGREGEAIDGRLECLSIPFHDFVTGSPLLITSATVR